MIGGTDHGRETGQIEEGSEAGPETEVPVEAESPVEVSAGMVAMCVEGRGVPVKIENSRGEVGILFYLY